MRCDEIRERDGWEGKEENIELQLLKNFLSAALRQELDKTRIRQDKIQTRQDKNQTRIRQELDRNQTRMRDKNERQE